MDHYSLNHNLMSKGVLMTLIVCGLLGLGSSLLGEIEEARTEGKILTAALKKNSFKLGVLSLIPAQLTYIVTRIRSYIIPFSAAHATAGIMLTTPFSVGTITLNVLAVTFIIELDDMA